MMTTYFKIIKIGRWSVSIVITIIFLNLIILEIEINFSCFRYVCCNIFHLLLCIFSLPSSLHKNVRYVNNFIKCLWAINISWATLLFLNWYCCWIILWWWRTFFFHDQFCDIFFKYFKNLKITQYPYSVYFFLFYKLTEIFNKYKKKINFSTIIQLALSIYCKNNWVILWKTIHPI